MNIKPKTLLLYGINKLKLAILIIFLFAVVAYAQNYYVDTLARVHMQGLFIGGVQVTSSAAELNVLDGIPAGLTAAELGILDGVTSNATELNVLDGIAAGLTAAELSILDGVTATTAELNVLAGIPGTLTAAELGYMDGVGSGVQAQLNTKAPIASPIFTGVVTMPTPFTLGATSVTATGTELNLLAGVPAGLTTTEIGYLDGVTSGIQAQIDAAAAAGGYQDKAGLVVKCNASNPTYQIDVDYTGLMIEDFADGTGNFTIDITASGANGLEASDSEATSTWYEIYVLHGTSGECGLLNETGTAIGTYPAGYTADERYVGSVYNNGSDDFLVFHHQGDWVEWDVEIHVLNSASPAATWTDVVCTSAAPPTSERILLYGYLLADGGGPTNVRVRLNGSNQTDSMYWIYITPASTSSSNQSVVGVDSNQIFEYDAGLNADNLQFYVRAYYDPI